MQAAATRAQRKDLSQVASHQNSARRYAAHHFGRAPESRCAFGARVPTAALRADARRRRWRIRRRYAGKQPDLDMAQVADQHVHEFADSVAGHQPADGPHDRAHRIENRKGMPWHARRADRDRSDRAQAVQEANGDRGDPGIADEQRVDAADRRLELRKARDQSLAVASTDQEIDLIAEKAARAQPARSAAAGAGSRGAPPIRPASGPSRLRSVNREKRDEIAVIRDQLGKIHDGPTLRMPPASSVECRRGTVRPSRSCEPHVFVVDREVVDAALRRRDPRGHPAWRHDPLHQALHERAIGGGRQPLALRRDELVGRDELSRRIAMHARPHADRAVEAR